jgi:transposase
MHLRTILNHRARYQHFIYGKERFEKYQGRTAVVISVRASKRSQGICSGCHEHRPTYDHSPPRWFEFIPFWGISIFFEYALRRVACGRCGVKVEAVPWADGKQQKTKLFLAFLAHWAEELPWQRVADRFHTSWQTVYRAVAWVVAYGLAHRQLNNVKAIGVDEVQYQKGHNYLTVVYQLDPGCRRLLWVGKKRTMATLKRFFRTMKEAVPDFCQRIEFVCSDMWKAYLKVIKKQIPNALHILDRFHIRQQFSKALDQVRRSEAARLRRAGQEPVLAKSRWLWLKKRGNLTRKQGRHLRQLLTMNLRTVKAYLLTEQFEHFWSYNSPTWAAKFLATWTAQAMASRIEPMKRVARMLRRHEALILNWFRARKQINNGISEGFNLNVKLAIRKARGFRTYEIAEIALYHQLGDLPKPIFTHQFW